MSEQGCKCGPAFSEYCPIHDARAASAGADSEPAAQAFSNPGSGKVGSEGLVSRAQGGPSLDVERLAKAMASMRWGWLGWTDRPLDGDIDRRTAAFHNAAEKLAAIYAYQPSGSASSGGASDARNVGPDARLGVAPEPEREDTAQ